MLYKALSHLKILETFLIPSRLENSGYLLQRAFLQQIAALPLSSRNVEVSLNRIFFKVALVKVVSDLLVPSQDVMHADSYLLGYVIGLIITNSGRHTQAISNAYTFAKLFIFSIVSKSFYFEYYLSHQIEKNDIADCM